MEQEQARQRRCVTEILREFSYKVVVNEVSLSTEILRIIQAANSISTEPILNVIDRDELDVIEYRARSDGFLNQIVKRMYKSAKGIGIEDTEAKVQLFNRYAEAALFLQLSSKVSIGRVPEGKEKKPDFKIRFRDKEYYAEIKSLTSVDVINKCKAQQMEALEARIDATDQLSAGRRFVSTELVDQPYYKKGRPYDPFGRKMVIERIIEKIKQDLKPCQFRCGETLLIVDLGHLLMPDTPRESLLPSFYDSFTGSCVSGVLWHVAFGQVGMQIYRPNVDGPSNMDGDMEKQGILVEYS